MYPSVIVDDMFCPILLAASYAPSEGGSTEDGSSCSVERREHEACLVAVDVEHLVLCRDILACLAVVLALGVYGEVVPYKEEQTNLMAYYRKGTDRTLLVVANYQHDAQDVVLPGTYKKVLMNNLDTLDLNGDILHMPGYQAVIFEM